MSTERDLAILEELAELGLVMARAAKLLACDGPTPPKPQELRELMTAYKGVTRSVRLTIQLKNKLQEPSKDRVTERKAEVARIMTRIGEYTQRPRELVERYTSERLDREFLGDILTRPTSEIIDHICKTLGVKVPWDRLSQEHWAQEELQTGNPGSPLAAAAAAALNPPPLGEGDREAVEGASSVSPGGRNEAAADEEPSGRRPGDTRSSPSVTAHICAAPPPPAGEDLEPTPPKPFY